MKYTSLVTGGAGFIGSHVANHCLRMGHSVVVLDDMSGGFIENVPPGAHFIRGSITDVSLVQKIFMDFKIDYIYHLAAYAAEGLSHFIRRFNYSNNLIGTVNLVNEAIKSTCKCFIFTSSIAVYGSLTSPMREESATHPEDPYGTSKLAAELDLECAFKQFGLKYIIFRPHNVYGEHQNFGDPYRNVIGIFINQLLRNQPMTVFGDGSQTRAFTHIDDVAPHIAHSIDVRGAYNEIINIGADEPYTVLDLAKSVARQFKVHPRIEFLPARNEVQHAFASHEKANRLLKATPKVSLDDGVARMVEWARTAKERTSKPFDGIEIATNLPPSWARLVR